MPCSATAGPQGLRVGYQSSSRRHGKRRSRRGAAAVELAVVAPMFVALLVGVYEVGRMLEVQNQLVVAVRDGARIAGKADSEGQSGPTNDKVIQEVQNALQSNGLPTEQLEVQIVDPSDHVTPIDLDNQTGASPLFELRVDLPYSAISGLGASTTGDLTLSATAVFRNARATVVQ